MAETILVRHGQASLGAANYDQLSDIGHQQAKWLGEHHKRLGTRIDRILMGSLARHRQTAEGILEGLGQEIPMDIDEGFNELRSAGLFEALQAQYPHLIQETGNLRRDYHNNMERVLTLWMSGEIATDGRVSWEQFCADIQRAFINACDGSAPCTLVVTSGGPISVATGQLLGADSQRVRSLMLRIKNSSSTHFIHSGEKISLDTFNDVSHLRHPDKQAFITFA
jgi:broad specificity phosphatase PhoE